MRSIAIVALAATGFVALPVSSFAQSTDEVLRRLEAKLDAVSKELNTVSKENVALRERVKRIESPQRASSATPDVRGKQPEVVTFAASLPVYKAPPAPVRDNCAANRWTGGYIGVHGAGVSWTANRTDQDEVLVDTATYVSKTWSAMGGAQIGYNWTRCNAVWGIEIDGAWADADAKMQLIPNSPFFNINVQSKFDGLATARTRIGFAVDNVMLYVTGGLAAGHFQTTYTNQFLGIPGVVAGSINQASFDDWRWGGVVGVGAEWAWTDRWTLRSEVLYVEFADRSHDRVLFAPPTTFAGFKESDSMIISRLALNYKL